MAKTDSGVIVVALGFRNEYDEHTLRTNLGASAKVDRKSTQKGKNSHGLTR